MTAAGARATEDRVLAEIEALLPSSSGDTELLGTPVVVVVPSRTLRLHLAARLVAARGRAATGIRIATLKRLALEILDRAGAAPLASGDVLPVLVSRAARGQGPLNGLIDALDDGLSPVVASVRDLLDAGVVPAHVEVLDERLAELPGTDSGASRARALLRIAGEVASSLEEMRVGVTSVVLREAAEALRNDPQRALPCRAVLVHGFADATGVATDLIEALVRCLGGIVVLDTPPDPSAPEGFAVGGSFTQRFRERLEGVAPGEASAVRTAPARLKAFTAPGLHAEVREVARRILGLLERGVRPEAIGVVARDLEPYRIAIQLHLGRLGVPFSASGARGFATPASRRVSALLDVLGRGGEAPADSWLAAMAHAGFGQVDLRVGLRTCGAVRLVDLAGLAIADVIGDGTTLALPVRRGLTEKAETEEPGDGRVRAPRRRLGRAELQRAVDAAGECLKALRALPASSSARGHAAAVGKLLSRALGWRDDTPGASEVEEALAELARSLPADLPLDREEFTTLLAAAVQDAGRAPLGGEGGVRVLGVTESRALTFEHLFLLGLNRDAFPRQVREDPLLPDRIRLALEPLVPDVPVKARGHDEERFLFAQLVSASPDVTLSWRVSDDDGKPETSSPLVEQLLLAGALQEPARAPDLATPVAGESRPAHEHALLAGLSGGRAGFAALVESALREGRGGHAEPGTAVLAAARLAVLDELEPDRRTAAGRERWADLGPYFGFLGETAGGGDPRVGDPAVTRLEGLAACGWQVFLRKLLHLEPPPDPLAGVPSLDRLLVGTLVHEVLRRIVNAAGELPSDLAGALAAAPRAVPWPAASELTALLKRTAREVAREAGLTFPGFGDLLARQAVPLLDAAAASDWPEAGALPVVGVEVEARFELPFIEGRRLAFRADRIERHPDKVRLTDYKSGRPDLPAGEVKRLERLMREVASGASLQAAAYALAVGEPAEGRYLFLGPTAEGKAREAAVDNRDPSLAPAFALAVGALFEAWQRGTFFPRVVDPAKGEEPKRCGWCEVSQACLRHDSGARRRISEWVGRKAGATEPPDDPTTAALLALWRLPLGGTEDDAPAEEGT